VLRHWLPRQARFSSACPGQQLLRPVFVVLKECRARSPLNLQLTKAVQGRTATRTRCRQAQRPEALGVVITGGSKGLGCGPTAHASPSALLLTQGLPRARFAQRGARSHTCVTSREWLAGPPGVDLRLGLALACSGMRWRASTLLPATRWCSVGAASSGCRTPWRRCAQSFRAPRCARSPRQQSRLLGGRESASGPAQRHVPPVLCISAAGLRTFVQSTPAKSFWRDFAPECPLQHRRCSGLCVCTSW
jgi:hypothetical protein